MTRLIVAKIDDDYVRFTAEGGERCGLGRASVFPESQAEELRARLARLGEGWEKARLMLLTIHEEPYGG